MEGSNFSTIREKREPYKFPSGGIYEGEWIGILHFGANFHANLVSTTQQTFRAKQIKR